MHNLLIGHTCSVNSIFLQDIFRFLLSMFEELDDIASPYFVRRANLLETVAKLRFCVVMLDTGCEDLILKMVKSFFSVVRFAFLLQRSSLFPIFLAVLHLLFCASFLTMNKGCIIHSCLHYNYLIPAIKIVKGSIKFRNQTRNRNLLYII